MKPYYQDAAVTIYHGDCREILPDVGEFDLVFTSPRYNLGGSPWPHIGNWKAGGVVGGKGAWRNGCDANGAGYGLVADDTPWADYETEQREIITALWNLLPTNGAIFYNHKQRPIGDRVWLPTELIPAGVLLRQIIVWDRGSGMNFTANYYTPAHEWILLLAKPDFRRTGQSDQDVWRVSPLPSVHPAPFPIGLPLRAINSTAATTILDPFLGSGTTLRAAKDLGRHAVGIEIEERYCEIAAKRMEQEVLALA